MNPKIGYTILLALVFGGIIAMCVFIAVSYIRQRKRRVEHASELADRFGLVYIRDMGATLVLIIDQPSFEGTLRATMHGYQSYAAVQFEGTLRTPQNAWTLRTLSPFDAFQRPGNIELSTPELRRRFKIVAQQPDEVQPLFDAEMEELLTELDAGILSALVRRHAAMDINVRGTELHILITAQRNSDDECLPRLLRFIERIGGHGA